MTEYFQNFLLAFIPLFVAMDAIGIVPVFISLTTGMPEPTKKGLVTQATITAFVIAIAFLSFGQLIFDVLGITAADFRIAGGAVLVVLAITDLLFSQEDARRRPTDSIGVVPIGIPLIMGPAAMTTILLLMDSYGIWYTSASLLVNLVIFWFLFRNSSHVVKIIGPGGTKAVAKVMALFLAAIGVMMIRVGVTAIISGTAH